MKQFSAEAGGRQWLPSWARRHASTCALAAFALIAASSAKANVVETFNLSGSFSIPSPAAFTGTVNLDFSDDFTLETVTSITISVGARPVFQSHSLAFALSGNQAVINASNSSGDMLSLMFATPAVGTFFGFDAGAIVGGQAIFGLETGFPEVFLQPSGAVIRNLSDPPIIDPPDPPPVPVPELSTWAMMLVGLAGLGLAARRRRVFKLPGWRRLSAPVRAS